MKDPCLCKEPIVFGICADVHQDIMHDASHRLQVFVDAVSKVKTDFNVQLGDFCIPKETNRSFSNIWDTLAAPGYHVLGNHDMDGGYTREQTVSYLSMPGRYYSFNMKGRHFVVLDGNDPTNPPAQGYSHTVTNPLNPPEQGYPHSIADDQFIWLQADLQATECPIIIFIHQSLDRGLVNSEQIRTLLEKTNTAAGWQKVRACFNGHSHIDCEININGIWYVRINSISTLWMGEDYIRVRYSKEIDKHFPLIKYTAPYRDPLYAIVTLEPGGKIQIDGVASEWVGPAPQEISLSHGSESIRPGIASRTLMPTAVAGS